MGSGMSQVLPGLFLGSFRSSRDLDVLKKNGVTHVVSVHDNAKPLEDDMEYLCIIASDTPEQLLAPEFARVNEFVHRARLNGGVVLVHCLAGISRSVTLTTAYVMSISGMGWKDSLNVVRGSRRQANPNLGFKLQLKEFESEGLEAEKAKIMALYAERNDNITHEQDLEECRKLLNRFNRWVQFGDKLEIEGESALVDRIAENQSSCPKKSFSADDILTGNDEKSKQAVDRASCSGNRVISNESST